MIGRFPDYDVLDSAENWDETTRAVVLARLQPQQQPCFFQTAELPTLHAFCDVVLAQDEEPRVPVAELIDEKLSAGRLDGYQYADMPDDRETWRLTLAGLDDSAAALHGREASPRASPRTRAGSSTLSPRADSREGRGRALNVARAWSVCTRMMLEAFYSHPWAWNEIGFGGPAYPRGLHAARPDRRSSSRTSVPERPVRIPCAPRRNSAVAHDEHPQGVPRASRERFSLPARRPPPRPSGSDTMRDATLRVEEVDL